MSCVVKLRELGRYSRKRMSLIGWQLLKLLMGIWSNWCCFQHSNWIGFFGRWFEDIYMKSISIKNYRTWIERIGPQPHRAVFFQIVDISDYVWFGRCHMKSTTHITHHIITAENLLPGVCLRSTSPWFFRKGHQFPSPHQRGGWKPQPLDKGRRLRFGGSSSVTKHQ